MAYKLYYWDGIQGRGEFVRLALEEAGADYVDVVRHEQPGMGTDAMLELLDHGLMSSTPFAPPFLTDGSMIVSHVANILFYLGPKIGLAPREEQLRYIANGLQLTITDFVCEAHDTHHPISIGLYYSDQQAEAKARSVAFINERIPKYLGYFERTLQQNPSGSRYIVSSELSYVDLSLFQVVEGLTYAFPNAMKGCQDRYPALINLHTAVRERPKIAAYLASPRRLAFSQDDVFRHYTELDAVK